ncbi:hypothetical protein ACJX0J_033117, partial [Zea mays]
LKFISFSFAPRYAILGISPLCILLLSCCYVLCCLLLACIKRSLNWAEENAEHSIRGYVSHRTFESHFTMGFHLQLTIFLGFNRTPYERYFYLLLSKNNQIPFKIKQFHRIEMRIQGGI